MPPKKTTLTPAAKQLAKTKETEKSRTIKDKDKPRVKDILKDANPIKRSSRSVGRAGDVRRQRDSHAAKIEEEKAEQEREMQDLQEQIAYYRRDNGKIRRQQTAKFGLTLDDVNVVKENLEHARYVNNTLFREVESRKEECDKLAQEMDIVVDRIEELTFENSDLLREKRIYEHELEQTYQNQITIQRLQIMNKGMRTVLLQHKINPNADASKIKVSQTSPQTRENAASNRLNLPSLYAQGNLHGTRESRTVERRRHLSRKPSKANLKQIGSNSSANDYRWKSDQQYLIEENQPYLLSRIQTVHIPSGRKYTYL